MAVKTVRVCDICGAEGAVQGTLRIDGATSPIDLCSEHVRLFASASQPAPRRTTTKSRYDPKVVRQWAREQGMEVSDKGRIPPDVLKAYNFRHA